MSVLSRPRAVSGRVFAAGSPAEMIAALQTGFEDFKSNHNKTINNAQRAIDDLNSRIAAIGANGPVAGVNDRPDDPQYSQAFSQFFRHGDVDDGLKAAQREGSRHQIHASMSSGSSSDGGYLAPTEWDRRVLAKLATVSPMRRICDVVVTGVKAYSTVWNGGAWGSGWVGETALRPGTTTPTLLPLTFSAGEIYANPAITANLLDDADFKVEAWLSGELATEFAKQEGIAFISGDGINKPNGLLTYVEGGTAAASHPGGAIAAFEASSGGSLLPDALIDLTFKLPAPYRQGASWLMSSTTAATVRKLKDGQGNYLYETSYKSGQPDQLLGYPVEIDENMPSISSGALPIVFGNFRIGYVINDRAGVRILRDPYTNKPYVNFYTTKRVGGGLRDPNAFKAMKIT